MYWAKYEKIFTNFFLSFRKSFENITFIDKYYPNMIYFKNLPISEKIILKKNDFIYYQIQNLYL